MKVELKGNVPGTSRSPAFLALGHDYIPPLRMSFVGKEDVTKPAEVV